MRRNFSLLIICGLTACSLFKPLDQRLVSEDERVRINAIKKMNRLSEPNKAALVKPLLVYVAGSEPRAANRAVDALILLGPSAVDGLRETLQNADVFVRVSAASVLERFGPSARSAIPELTEALKDSHPLMREEAARALGQMGPLAAQDAGPALLQTRQDSNPEVKNAASEALKKIGITPPRIS